MIIIAVTFEVSSSCVATKQFEENYADVSLCVNACSSGFADAEYRCYPQAILYFTAIDIALFGVCTSDSRSGVYVCSTLLRLVCSGSQSLLYIQKSAISCVDQCPTLQAADANNVCVCKFASLANPKFTGCVPPSKQADCRQNSIFNSATITCDVCATFIDWSLAVPVCVASCPLTTFVKTSYEGYVQCVSSCVGVVSFVGADGRTCLALQQCNYQAPFTQYLRYQRPSHVFQCVSECASLTVGPDSVCYPHSVTGQETIQQITKRNTKLVKISAAFQFQFTTARPCALGQLWTNVDANGLEVCTAFASCAAGWAGVAMFTCGCGGGQQVTPNGYCTTKPSAVTYPALTSAAKGMGYTIKCLDAGLMASVNFMQTNLNTACVAACTEQQFKQYDSGGRASCTDTCPSGWLNQASECLPVLANIAWSCQGDSYPEQVNGHTVCIAGLGKIASVWVTVVGFLAFIAIAAATAYIAVHQNMMCVKTVTKTMAIELQEQKQYQV